MSMPGIATATPNPPSEPGHTPADWLSAESLIPAGWRRTCARPLLTIAEPFLRFAAVNETYRRVISAASDERGFFQRGLAELGVTLTVSEKDRLRIPRSGPVVVVCNHPYGGADGVAMGALLTALRPDCRLMVNLMLSRLPGMSDHVIAVDPFGGREAAKRNVAGMRQALAHLKAGGLLAIWPAGTVSHLNVRQRQVTDPQWVANIASLIQKSQASVVPAYFPGRNSNLFQTAGLIHPRLRTLLLAREMMSLSGRQIEIRIGKPIRPDRLAQFADSRQLMDYLRLKTYILQDRAAARKISIKPWRRHRIATEGVPVIGPRPKAALAGEIASLASDQLLTSQGEYGVYQARADQIPHLLREIGRLREITFRAVGEGTGTACDLDAFDQSYVHLFVWNHDRQELVGAYRMGLTDEILPVLGKRGLYTHTLFRYKPQMLARVTPAIELGRSFVVGDYQRKYFPLALLWSGIGRFIVANPRYRTLFGPVSISQDYNSLSKNLIVQYLQANSLDADLAHRVKARRPVKARFLSRIDRHTFTRTMRDIDDVSSLISEIEREERGVPVLLRQYLKLNATMLSFNVDPEFNNCIDGLVLVDLLRTEPQNLARYLGKDGLQTFLAWHGRAPAAE
jgi:putative hemolysin